VTKPGLVVDIGALHDAWDHVATRDAEDGVVSSSVRRFAIDAPAELQRLRGELLSGSYTPRRLTRVEIAKTGGGIRTLDIPPARDRVVERLVSSLLTPIIDEILTPRAFAYRSGLSIAQAIEQLVTWRDDGYTTVARADVDECFPTIDRHRLGRMLDGLHLHAGLRSVVDQLLSRSTQRPGYRPFRVVGLAQGGSLSPVLSNLYLHHVDIGLIRTGVPHIRYADDLVLVARNEQEVANGLDELARLVAQGGQRVGSDKTEVTTFAEGFVFLGEEIGPRYPTQSPTQWRAEPERRTVHVGRQGAGVRLARGRLKVMDGDEELLSVPVTHVARLVLAGAVGLSAGARSWALANGIDVVLLSRRGSFLGRIASASSTDIGLRRRQMSRTSDDPAMVDLARGLVHGKLSNMRTLLLRHASGEEAADVVAAAEEIHGYRELLGSANSPLELMGVEGIASRVYWAAFRALLPDGIGFATRQRRPAPDVVNAALGYGYAILQGEVEGALASTGLDPSVGVLHADVAGRPSLALDLMEEFRPLIVDQVVVELARRSSITAESGRTDPVRPGGVLLTEDGRRSLVAALEDRLLTMFRHLPTGDRVTYRRSLILQAQQVARVVGAENVDQQTMRYRPVLWR